MTGALWPCVRNWTPSMYNIKDIYRLAYIADRNLGLQGSA